MKKLITYILLLSIAFSFAACAAANQAGTNVKALEKEVVTALRKQQNLSEDEGIAEFRYYGTYNGYHIAFLIPPVDLGEKTLTVAECSFYYPSTFYIYAYKDGKLIDLATANAQGIVSKEAIAEAAKIHAAYEKPIE